MYETTNELRDREDNARQKDEVYEELKSELNTLRENCVQREGKQFTVPENVERLERLDGEIIEVPAEKIPVDEATTLGAVAFLVDVNIIKNDYIKGEVEEVNLVDDVNSLEIGGYVAKESIKLVATLLMITAYYLSRVEE